jgi:hypothetical protein
MLTKEVEADAGIDAALETLMVTSVQHFHSQLDEARFRQVDVRFLILYLRDSIVMSTTETRYQPPNALGRLCAEH